MPASKSGKGVGAHEAKKGALRRQLGAQGEKRFQGVVGNTGGFGRIGEGEGKARFAGNGHAGHGKAILKIGDCALRFEGLRADGRKEHGVEAERLQSRAGDAEMAEVGRVETATKEGCALATAGFLVHEFIVICAGRPGSASNEVCDI